MRWRISAWTHPADPAGFILREHSIPAIKYSGTDPEQPRGRCTITVPESYDWTNLITVQNPTDPSDTSLIRLYRDGQDNTTDPDVEYLLERFQKRILDDGTAVVELYGVDWRLAGLDAAVLRWWDWVAGATRSRQRDWSYGGDDQTNLLRNLDFDGQGISEKQQYHLHAASGNYTITVPTYGTTGNLQPYEAGGRASDVKTALEAIAGINEVSVTGQGHTQFDPLVIEFIDPLGDIGLITINDIDLVFAGCAHPPCHAPVEVGIRDGEFHIDPWTRIQTRDGILNVPIHGTYNSITVVDDPDLGAPTKAVLIDAKTSNAGLQQLVPDPEEGFRANVSVEVYSSSTTDEFTLQVHNLNENVIAISAIITLVANTWTKITIADFTLPDQLNGDLIWRIKVSSGGAVPADFYVKNPTLNYGVAAATIGAITIEMLADAQVDHPTVDRLPWLAQGAFTAVLDSSAVAWTRSEHLILRRGKKYGTHIIGGQFADLGYEYDLTPNGATANWELEIWNNGNRGATLSGLALVVGMGVAGGLVAGRLPRATRWLAEGADGIITEAANAAQEAATGIVEEFVGDPDITDTSTLAGKAQHFLDSDITNRLALTVELDDSAPVPYADIDVGDTAEFQYAGMLAKHDRRIADIALRAEAASSGELIWGASVTASRLFSGDAALNEAVYRLLRVHERQPQQLPKRTPGVAPTDGGGGAPTVVVAAADSSEGSKARADFICGGLNDEDPIQAAIDLLPSGGGRILLCEGSYDLGGTVTFPNTNISIEGVGFPTIDGANVPLVGSNAIWFQPGSGAGITQRLTGLRFSGGKADDRPVKQPPGECALYIENCIFQDLTCASSAIGGLPGTNPAVVVITDCLFDTITILGGGSLNAGLIHTDNPAARHLFYGNTVKAITYSQAGSATFRMENATPLLATGNDFDITPTTSGSAIFIAHNMEAGAHVAGSHPAVDHGSLSGLGDDDHPQYRLESEDHSHLTAGLQGGTVPGADTTAIHDDTAAEISAVTEKTVPVNADLVLIEDSAAANAKKRVQVGNLPAPGGTDSDAIHDNVAGEIVLITEKGTPVNADLVVIEDSAAANAKKRVQVGNLPGGGGVPTFWKAAVVGSYDDYFDADSSADWTAVAPDTGSAVWAYNFASRLGENNRGFHADYDDQAVGDFAAQLKSLSGIAIGDYIQTSLVLFGISEQYRWGGIVLTDGTTSAANAVSWSVFGDGTLEYKVISGEGTLTTHTTHTINLYRHYEPAHLHLRLIYQAANTFRCQISLNGEDWRTIGSDLSETFTPTHGGFVVTTYGGANPMLTNFRYFHSNVTP